MAKQKIYRQNDEECRAYLTSIKDIKEIAPGEWDGLLRDIVNGDSATAGRARQRLITGCLPMVVRLASRYDYLEELGVKRIDLIGAGNLILTEVANWLTEMPSVALEAYLVTWIKKAIIEARDKYLGYVRLNVTGDTDDDDTDDEAMPRTITVSSRSLDDTLSADSETTLSDIIDDDAVTDRDLIRASARQELMRQLSKWFSYEEAGILYDTYLSDQRLTAKECVHKYGLTPRQIRDIREATINRLHDIDKRDIVRDLLQEAV